jgi:hypothetical protein
VIVAGYLVVACRDLGTAPVVSPALALPLAAGVLPAVLVGGAAPAATGLVLWRLALFSEQDADLVARLDLPASVRSRAVRAIRRLARD